MLEALARGALAIDDTISVQGAVDTVGRYLVQQCVPHCYRGRRDAPWDRAAIVELLWSITRELHVELAARCAAALEQLGRYVAERSGFSLCLDDFKPGFEVEDVFAAAWREVDSYEEEYRQGRITDGQRYSHVVAAWRTAAARVLVEARRHAPLRDPLAACEASDPHGLPPEAIRILAGVIARRSEAYERPILGGPAIGYDAHAYFMLCTAAREHRTTLARCASAAVPLQDSVHAALHDVAIVAVDCGTSAGVELRTDDDDRAGIGSLGARAEGRVVVADVVAPSGALVAQAGALVTPALARTIDAEDVGSVVVRDVLACECDEGVCARCFGLAPEDAIWPAVGDKVGARAAHAISGAALRFRDHYFHIC